MNTTPPTHYDYLTQCIHLARQAVQMNEVPVGAIVVHSESQRVVASAHNLKESLQSPLGHAEILAIHKACRKNQSWRLHGHILYSSLEPCLMCSSLILESRLDKVIFSAWDQRAGGQSLHGLLDGTSVQPGVSWEKGPLGEESARLLKDFFQKKRFTSQFRIPE